VPNSVQRGLTKGEETLARAAFVNRIAYDKVRISDGPGNHPFAHLAFAKGNPAITIGSTIYFKTDYCADFSAPGANRKSFLHEMTHVWQYRALGMPTFFLRYGEDLIAAKGNPDDMYNYVQGTDRFDKAMIEAQAEMVADYSEALWSDNRAAKDKLARNLAGSGVYGL
jgi:hypothetical protein